jgi:hypothetical protein
MLDRQHGRLVVECDSCGETREQEDANDMRYAFDAFIQGAKADGWKIGKFGRRQERRQSNSMHDFNVMLRTNYQQACDAFFADPNIQKLVDALAARRTPLRRDELAHALRAIHPFALSVMMKALKRGFSATSMRRRQGPRP